MNKTRLFTVFAILCACLSPVAALAGKTNNFYGDVVHVSVNNLKVYNPKSHQTLSFIVTPKFDRVFSANGKTTYQMKDVKSGQYVRVVYDQKALGMRHADMVYILHSNNTLKGRQIPTQIH